jgi:hypothetical protein
MVFMKKKVKIIKIDNSPGGAKPTIAEPEKNDLPAMAKYLERTEQPDKAAKLYEKLIKGHRFNEHNYNRLLMIYRKKKDFKNELRILDTGIKAFQEFYMPFATGKDRTVINLSKKLNVLIGLTDRKGKSLADREPIAKWKKRKEIVLKKLKG